MPRLVPTSDLRAANLSAEAPPPIAEAATANPRVSADAPTSSQPRRAGRRRRTFRAKLIGLQAHALVVIALVLVVGALKAAEGFIVPVVTGLVIALALAPMVRRLERFMPRWIASALIVSALVGALGFMVYSLSDEASQAVAQLPEATRVLRQTFRGVASRSEGAISQLQRAAKELQRTASESSDRPSTPAGVTPVQVVAPPVDFSNIVWFGSQGVLSIAGLLTVLVFLVYFLLATGDLFKRKLVRLSGDRLSRRRVTVQMIDQIGERVARSMLHLILTSVFVGLCTWALLAAFGVRYSGLWGLAAGLLNCVPYLGPAVVASGLLVAGLMQFGDVATAAMIAGASLVVTTLEGSLLTPILFGRDASLNAVAVFVSFLFWGWLWGASGMLLALPLLTIIKTVAESIEDLQPLAELLGD
jgi:predicted PurR-regulated permease PerM